jgi:hypothetical protein
MIMVLLVAASTGTGCAAALSTAMRHEIGAGLGFVGSDEPAQNAVWTTNDAVAWTANYAFRVCDQCETFRLFVDIPLVVIPRQDVLAAGLAVPDGRRDVYVIPNARFSILLFEKAALFVGGGGGIGHFTESARMTTGEANPNAQRSTRAVVGVHPGLEAQLTEALGIRFGLWVVGPRPALSFPMRRGQDCTQDCGDTTLSYLFSVVYHF